MTLVNTATGEIVEYDRAAAERRAERIRLRLDTIADNLSAVLPMIREAIAQRDDIALGYRSPGEYVADRFGQALSGLGIEVRRAVVGELTEAGLSSRAIAPVVGTTDRQVRRDQRAASGGTHVPPAPTPEPADEGEADAGSGHAPEGGDAPAATVEPGADQESAPPRPPVTGIDGKTYSRPEPKPTADQAVAEFPDLAHYAGTDPQRAVLMADDLRRARGLGELDQRLDSLRRAIALDRSKADGTYRPGMTAVPDAASGGYRMAPLPSPITTTRTCPTCNGQGVIKEQA